MKFRHAESRRKLAKAQKPKRPKENVGYYLEKVLLSIGDFTTPFSVFPFLRCLAVKQQDTSEPAKWEKGGLNFGGLGVFAFNFCQLLPFRRFGFGLLWAFTNFRRSEILLSELPHLRLNVLPTFAHFGRLGY